MEKLTAPLRDTSGAKSMVTPDYIYTNDGCRATLASPGNLGNTCHQHLASESKQEDVQGDVGCHVNSGEDIDASQMM